MHWLSSNHSLLRSIGRMLLAWLFGGYLALPLGAQAQFYTLTTADGLSDNYINSMTVDRNGYVWIGTGSGLNRFNGKQVERFFNSDRTPLGSDIIRQVTCDSANRLWVLNDRADLTIIDEERRFRPVILEDSDGPIRLRYVFQTAAAGTVLMTNRGLWQFPTPATLPEEDTIRLGHLTSLPLSLPDSLLAYPYFVQPDLSADRYVVESPSYLFILDFNTLSLKGPIACDKCRTIGSLDGQDPVLYQAETRTAFVLHVQDETRTPLFGDITDQAGQSPAGLFVRMVRLDDEDFLLNTYGNGSYVFRPSKRQLVHYPYVAGDPAGLASPNPNIIAVSPSGWAFLGCTPQGVSYFNHHAIVGQQTLFRDGKGRSYDRAIVTVATSDNDTYYIVTDEADLLVWTRSTNTSRFVRTARDTDPNGLLHHNNAVLIDPSGRPWVTVTGEGIVILDPKTLQVVRRIDLSQGRFENRYRNNLRYLTPGPDGKIWACSQNGVTRIDPDDYRLDRFEGTVLDSINTTISNHIAWLRDGRLWIATETKGVFVFDLPGNRVRRLTVASGDLPSNSAYCINEDREGNVYIGTAKGLSVFLTDGRKLEYGPANGLLNDRLEVLLLDDKDRMWFGNDVGIGCFNIADTTIRMFDERFGLSVMGFRVYAYHQNSDGELIWGTERGLQFFYPDAMYNQAIELMVTTHRMESRDIDRWVTHAGTFTLPPGNDFVTLHFSTLDFSKHIRTFYQYRLEGLDPGWITVMDQQSARYNSLAPGTYTFRVRASHDGKTWHEGEYPVTFTLQPFFYQTGWFRILLVLALAGLVFGTYKAISRRIRHRAEELEAEAIVQYFASTINRHKNTQDMLWDVARNCISRLGLEECIIYLRDPVRDVLTQQAAMGPKGREDLAVINPMEVPVGKGITGYVARTGEPLLVPDTEKDPRYIVDDRRRLSEIAVPIVLEGQVIGVIDSEHSRRNFFNSRHLRLLTTVAVLMAAQIRRNEAEDAKRRAEMEILKNRQQAAESRLQSLRLQMNPHFLFNALNSIQQMILANEELVATKYLSRFSKLLRSVLIHSDKETVTLKEELDILKLYIELESVRFKEAFRYSIDVDDDLDPEEVRIPTLLVQPFVENAIWHGLMHKEGDRHLRIAFSEEDDVIRCVIEDNGIGRAKAGELKQISGSDKKHTSKGIAVARERLLTLQKNGHPAGHIEFTDLTDDQGQPAGTRVDIRFPSQF